MAYVELGQDNGGILLNLGEGGFAVQSALALTSREFPQLRFQVPAVQGWLTAGGRIAWISDSNKEAGIQFTELPGEARKEIQRWVSAEGEPETPGARAPVRSKESSPKQIRDMPYRGAGGAHEPAAQSTHANWTQAESVGAAVSEPPPQDFQFPEYSMFAADSGRAGAWVEPPRHREKGRGVGRGLLVAVLFFALGATVGQETVERWIADLRGWTQNELTPAPKVTPPAPPEQAGATVTTEAKSKSNSVANEDTKAEDRVNSTSELMRSSEVGKEASQKANNAEKQTDNTEVPKPGSAVKTGSATGAISPGAMTSGKPRHLEERRYSTETAVPRDVGEMEAAPTKMAAEHSILVNAPEPGRPPFFVNLPGEAVSASGAIAISARRTLEILPRSSSSSGRAERVVIGKLISHSEPFYPVEARNRHIEGNVELRARVGRTGQIISVTPVSGPQLLSSAAMTAVREWRYGPTFVDGDPAETIAEITVVFRLR
jgi:TonB family protein